MSETYCGKSCSECTWKEALKCPGCRVGPGRSYGGDCEVARCCRNKGHESCDTCSLRKSCGALMNREREPEYRKRKIDTERQQKEAMVKRAPFFGKWLWLLFWLVVPSTVAGIMNNQFVMKSAPNVYMIGQILSVACSIAYGVILFKLSAEENKYRTAGICTLVSAAAGILTVSIHSASTVPTSSLIITLPAAIVALYGEYSEYIAHSAVLAGVDNALSENWTALWKLYIGFTIGMFGSILLAFAAPLLALIVLIGSTVGIVVVSIMKLVYLYRTAKVFREYRVDKFAQAR